MLNQGKGLGIATDSRTAYDIQDREIRITALRSPIYADHYGERDEFCDFTEQGEQRFCLYLNAVDGDITALHHMGELLSRNPDVIMGGYHAGSLPAQSSIMEIDTPLVEASALKKGEDSDAVILRLHSLADETVEAGISFYGTSFRTIFGPQQIKTFRILGGDVQETDFLEIQEE